jgi:hypothetical protein
MATDLHIIFFIIIHVLGCKNREKNRLFQEKERFFANNTTNALPFRDFMVSLCDFCEIEAT